MCIRDSLKHLDILFNKLRSSNLVLNYDKFEFGNSQITFLIHILSAQGVSIDPEKVQAVTEFPTPKKAKNIRAFLGITGYYRRFTPDYSKTIEPLLELLRKSTKWRWETIHENTCKVGKELFTRNVFIELCRIGLRYRWDFIPA